MNYYLRKNGTVIGPMPQADFLARLASGEYSATDEMSTDGKIWTRLGLTSHARSIQQARFASTPRIGAVVRDLTGQTPAPGNPTNGAEAQKQPQQTAFPPTQQPVYRRSSPAKKAISILVVLLIAALGALAWFMTHPTDPSKPADEKHFTVQTEGISTPVEDAAAIMSRVFEKSEKFSGNASKGLLTSREPSAGPLPSEFAKEAMESTDFTTKEVEKTGVGSQRSLQAMMDKMKAEDGDSRKDVVSLDDPYVQKAIKSYLAPSTESQDLLLTSILKSEHVRQKFSDVASTTHFEYLADSDFVNADSSIGHDGDNPFGRIRLYGGLVRMARLMGAVLCFGEPARSQDEKVLLSFLRDLGATFRKSGNKCSLSVMQDLMNRHGVEPDGFTSLVKRTAAEKVANAIVESVLAHEFGHLAKGHLKGSDANHQISQIEEQEADLFASTIAASVPEGAEVFAGQVLSMIVFSFIDDGSGERLRSHPVPRERVINAIRANPEYAAAAGLTEEGVRAFYKSLDDKKDE